MKRITCPEPAEWNVAGLKAAVPGLVGVNIVETDGGRMLAGYVHDDHDLTAAAWAAAATAHDVTLGVVEPERFDLAEAIADAIENGEDMAAIRRAVRAARKRARGDD